MSQTEAPIRWYFDVISPFAYLQWPRVRALMQEAPVQPVPVLLGAILEARGQLGPAEIPSKRSFTYQHVLWQARQAGVPLVFPPRHPFNPLYALRLCIAAGVSAHAVDTLFQWIWAEGQAADTADALARPREVLGVPQEATESPEVKAALRANTEAAIDAGVFGVPTLAVGSRLFWGNDAHDFAVAAWRDPSVLEDDEMRRVLDLPVGVQRR